MTQVRQHPSRNGSTMTELSRNFGKHRVDDQGREQRIVDVDIRNLGRGIAAIHTGARLVALPGRCAA